MQLRRTRAANAIWVVTFLQRRLHVPTGLQTTQAIAHYCWVLLCRDGHRHCWSEASLPCAGTAVEFACMPETDPFARHMHSAFGLQHVFKPQAQLSDLVKTPPIDAMDLCMAGTLSP